MKMDLSRQGQPSSSAALAKVFDRFIKTGKPNRHKQRSRQQSGRDKVNQEKAARAGEQSKNRKGPA